MESELTGFLSGESELAGQLSGEAVLVGYLTVPDRIKTVYDGPYEVVPSGDFQLMPTSESYLEDDIIVHPIPYQKVSNEYGGYTVTIGE